MIRGTGDIPKVAGTLVADQLQEVLGKLPDNASYKFVICDEKRNRNLPFLSYLFSVVLKYLSDALPNHPSPTSLYKYFEKMYAPVHFSEINGERFEYRDLKSEKSRDVNDVIEKIVEYALNEWGIEVPRQEELREPEMRELYSQAYISQEVDWSSFISSRKNISKDERRNQKQV